MELETILWTVTITITCGIFLYFVREEGRRLNYRYPIIGMGSFLLFSGLFVAVESYFVRPLGKNFMTIFGLDGYLKEQLALYITGFFALLGIFNMIILILSGLFGNKS